MKKLLPIIIIAIIAVGGGAFYVGMKYQESKMPQGLTRGNFQNLQNLSAEERQQRLDQLGASGIELRGGRLGNQVGGGFATGEIISKDDKSITVKLRDGGSKIVFFLETTDIQKLTNGSVDDLKEGEQILVNGEQNSDGSITAKTIQISPF